IGRRKSLSEAQPDLSPRFIKVVERALAPNPDERYPTAGALLDAFEALTRDRVSIRRIVSVTAIALVATTALFLGIGLLTSRVFNAALGRGDFADESWLVWLTWGIRASVGPVFYMARTLAVLGPVIVLRRLSLALFPRARAFDAAALRLGASAGRRFH